MNCKVALSPCITEMSRQHRALRVQYDLVRDRGAKMGTDRSRLTDAKPNQICITRLCVGQYALRRVTRFNGYFDLAPRVEISEDRTRFCDEVHIAKG